MFGFAITIISTAIIAIITSYCYISTSVPGQERGQWHHSLRSLSPLQGGREADEGLHPKP